jgi:GNAT superfamily N-acetyltransferase
MSYQISRFHESDASELAGFLNHIRQHHWSLSSFAHNREPRDIKAISAQDLIAEHHLPGHLGTFLLRKDGQLVSSISITDRHEDGKVAVLSRLDTHPRFQRRGLAWSLGVFCIRRCVEMGFDLIKLQTWPYNRKGIPLYKRAGFRAVPGTSLDMENYLPLILKDHSVGHYFRDVDYITALQGRRSYGYDDRIHNATSVFEYQWKSVHGGLIVEIDWRNRQIAAVEGQVPPFPKSSREYTSPKAPRYDRKHG